MISDVSDFDPATLDNVFLTLFVSLSAGPYKHLFFLYLFRIPFFYFLTGIQSQFCLRVDNRICLHAVSSHSTMVLIYMNDPLHTNTTPRKIRHREAAHIYQLMIYSISVYECVSPHAFNAWRGPVSHSADRALLFIWTGFARLNQPSFVIIILMSRW